MLLLSAGLFGALNDEELRRRIAQVRSHSQGGGMLVEQYEHFYRQLQARAPSRVLVWGLGHDSALTAELNAGGETLFVESSPVWARTIGTAHPNLKYSTYDQDELGTSISTWQSFLRQPHGLEVAPRLRSAVERDGRCWDIILVDAPDGSQGRPSAVKRAPGRAVPIYEASRLRGRCNTTVFVHDCARTVEIHVSRRFLGEPSVVLPARARRALLSAGRPHTRGHNKVPKVLCRYEGGGSGSGLV